MPPPSGAPPTSAASRLGPRARGRDAALTRARILAAASGEFGRKGLDGARLDPIARQAGVSRELLLYHFKSKRGLYQAVMEHALARQFPGVDARAVDPAERLVALYRVCVLDPQRIRLQLWEGLDFQAGVAASPEARLRNVRAAVDLVRQNQASGLLPKDLDPELLAIMFLALALFPVAFPQLVLPMVGDAPSDEAFRARYEQFLRQLAAQLRARARGGASQRGRSRRSAE
jgi:TetR/AcrR family transcriptional regulator